MPTESELANLRRAALDAAKDGNTEAAENLAKVHKLVTEDEE